MAQGWFGILGWTGYTVDAMVNTAMKDGVRMSQDAGMEGGKTATNAVVNTA